MICSFVYLNRLHFIESDTFRQFTTQNKQLHLFCVVLWELVKCHFFRFLAIHDAFEIVFSSGYHLKFLFLSSFSFFPVPSLSRTCIPCFRFCHLWKLTMRIPDYQASETPGGRWLSSELLWISFYQREMLQTLLILSWKILLIVWTDSWQFEPFSNAIVIVSITFQWSFREIHYRSEGENENKKQKSTGSDTWHRITIESE